MTTLALPEALRNRTGIGFFVAALTAFGMVTGMVAVSARFLQTLVTEPATLLLSVLIVGVASGAGAWWCLRTPVPKSARRFMVLIALLCTATRLTVVALFPDYGLTGDESQLHQFVAELVAKGIGHSTLSELSRLYDYPVWLARAFPFYYPLRVVFGEADVMAVRVLNVILSVVTIVLVFPIAQSAAGPRYARLSVWLLAIFPYHLIGVLSYDPQIPGTFFFLAGVLLILRITTGGGQTWRRCALLAAGLGVTMLLSGVQRGGVDLLLAAVFLLGCIFGRLDRSRTGIAIVVTLLCWLPARYGLSTWIDSHDSHRLRSHTLGFMTRGWNPVSLGEYFGPYEQLDIATPVPEKRRTLGALLATQIVRQPVTTLIVLPVAKTAKFFAVGSAPFAASGLEVGGYRAALTWSRALTIAYAPVFLFFSIAGIVVALRRRTISMPLFLLAALVLSAAAGIVLLWETSPRYSHPIHFALAIFAALGFGAIRHGILQFASGGSPIAWRLLRVLAALVAVWAILALTAYAAARQSPTFVDMRQATFTLNDTLLAGTPVDRSTESWETALTIPRGTPLPATVRVIPSFVDGSAGQHFRMSLRIPAVGGSPPRMVFRDCNGQIESWFPEDLVRMKRGCWQDRIEITLLPPQEQTTRTDQELALAVGYALRF